MSITKRPPRRGLAGDKKIRSSRAHNVHAPDAVEREYRGEIGGRKEFFRRKFRAKSDWPERRNSRCCSHHDWKQSLRSLRAGMRLVFKRFVRRRSARCGFDPMACHFGWVAHACVSRVGLGVTPRQSFLTMRIEESLRALREVRDDETPAPTRETRALPGNQVR